jgi:Holliday junction resolvase RusA-like endonuclease
MKQTFTIIGEPMGKQRPKFSRAGSFVKTYTPEATANYEQWVKLSYMQQRGDTAIIDDKEIAVTITAYFKIPASVSKKKAEQMRLGYIRPTKKPDFDNITKIICDALNGLAYKDDAAIVSAIVEKYYATDDEPKVIVEIKTLEP